MWSQKELDPFFDNAAIGIITVDPEGAIAMINEFALHQFGYEAGELTGRKIETLIPERFRTQHAVYRTNYQHHNPHKRPMGVDIDLSALRKDGSEFPVEVSLSTYHTEDGPFTIAFVSDITVRQAAEQALIRMNEELEQKVTARTEALMEVLEREKDLSELKSRFVSMASHEFRTPLSTIHSSAYLISKYEEKEDQPKRDRHIERIVSCVNMLTDVLNDFLSVGRIEEGRIQVRPETIHISSWMDHLTRELEPVLKPGQQLEYAHEGAEEVSFDPSLMKHIVQNLVSNAIKYSPEDAPIQMRTACRDHHFTLEVADRGIGIPEADQQHLFERFFRGTNVTNIQGTGLGLHIVSKYAELMNGTITCRSVPGEGTTFRVTLSPEVDPL